VSKSLWNMPDSESVLGPVQIMREQGEILTRSTDGKLQYNIQTSGSGQEIVNDFNIVVPSLGFYIYTVGRYVQRPLAIYPGRFHSQLIGEWKEISDESVFRGYLGYVLGSQAAADLIKTLLSQVA